MIAPPAKRRSQAASSWAGFLRERMSFMLFCARRPRRPRSRRRRRPRPRRTGRASLACAVLVAAAPCCAALDLLQHF
eukprot:1104321-Prymnesium_polylepis.1